MSDISNQPFTIIGPNQPASSLGPNDFCTEVAYNQVDACHVHAWFRSRRSGCHTCLPLFFGFGHNGSNWFPTPTDEGLPPGLAPLPLGYHYPQVSTDRKSGRTGYGVWAIENGKIFIAPWIQSTETVIVKWEGIKRSWGEDDPIDDDPLLSKAVLEYVRWKHADIFDRDDNEAARARDNYEGPNGAKPWLIHQCREETRVRVCEPSQARSSARSLTSLFYNDQQSASVSCPDGTTGNPVTVTIPAGAVSSTISKSDANAKAQTEALSQAQAQLVCTGTGQTFQSAAVTYTASCQGEPDAPPPEGSPVTITLPAGSITSTVSQADADAQALALAQQEAEAQLTCTFWNKSVTVTITCPDSSQKSSTVAAHTYSSIISQADADDQATNAATTAAQSQCSQVFLNTLQQAVKVVTCRNLQNPSCTVTVTYTVQAGQFTSTVSQAEANKTAFAYAQQKANDFAVFYCSRNQCGTFNLP